MSFQIAIVNQNLYNPLIIDPCPINAAMRSRRNETEAKKSPSHNADPIREQRGRGRREQETNRTRTLYASVSCWGTTYDTLTRAPGEQPIQRRQILSSIQNFTVSQGMQGGIALSSAFMAFCRLGRAGSCLGGSWSLNHRAVVQKSSSLLFVDMQPIKQPMPYRPQNRIDFHEFPILQWYLSSCALVVPSGGA